MGGVPFVTGLGEICYYVVKNKFFGHADVERVNDEEILLDEESV